jgi:hypothetical protein
MKAIKKLDNLSESSKEQYLFYLSKINNGSLPNNATFFFNFDDIKEKIKDYLPNTKISIVNIIMTILSKYSSYKYMKYYKIYKNYRDNILYKEKESYMKSKNNIEPEILNIDITKINSPITRFIYCLYTLQVPRRAKDYYNMVIVSNQESLSNKLNYLCENDKIFIFNIYKTSNSYGTQKIPISDELWNEYLKYKSSRSNKNNNLLQKENGDIVDNNQFISYHLNKVLGEGKSVNFLRHYYVKKNLGDTHKKIENIAELMGHSSTTNNYYFNY